MRHFDEIVVGRGVQGLPRCCGFRRLFGCNGIGSTKTAWWDYGVGSVFGTLRQNKQHSSARATLVVDGDTKIVSHRGTTTKKRKPQDDESMCVIFHGVCQPAPDGLLPRVHTASQPEISRFTQRGPGRLSFARCTRKATL